MIDPTPSGSFGVRLAQKHAGLLPTEIKRLKQLEDENARLQKLVAKSLRLRDVGSRRLNRAGSAVAGTCTQRHLRLIERFYNPKRRDRGLFRSLRSGPHRGRGPRARAARTSPSGAMTGCRGCWLPCRPRWEAICQPDGDREALGATSTCWSTGPAAPQDRGRSRGQGSAPTRTF